MNADVEIFAQDGTMNEICGHERSFHSDVETFVVWSLLLLSSPVTGAVTGVSGDPFGRFGHPAGLTFTVCPQMMWRSLSGGIRQLDEEEPPLRFTVSRTSQVYESHYVYKLQFRFIYSWMVTKSQEW